MAPRMTGSGRQRAFGALVHRNYRLYLLGQGVSSAGTWMQRIAQAWLVLDLTGSPLSLGLLTALQYLPLLVLSLVAGVVADRAPKRRLLVVTQIAAILQAGLLGLLTLSGTIQLWQ